MHAITTRHGDTSRPMEEGAKSFGMFGRRLHTDLRSCLPRETRTTKTSPLRNQDNMKDKDEEPQESLVRAPCRVQSIDMSTEHQILKKALVIMIAPDNNSTESCQVSSMNSRYASVHRQREWQPNVATRYTKRSDEFGCHQIRKANKWYKVSHLRHAKAGNIHWPDE